MDLRQYIREIPDWPKKGVSFKDITPLLEDGSAFRRAVDRLAKEVKGKNIDKIVGIEARGFIFAAALAYKLKAGLLIARKKGKLPRKTICEQYCLEYGTDTLEMHEDSVKKGERVLIVDDVLATGETAKAVVAMVEKLGGKVAGLEFVIELKNLGGREKLAEYPVFSLISYGSK